MTNQELVRAKAVVAMEFLVRHINDEDVFMPWLMTGVADGDISHGSLDIGEVDEYYVKDDNFKELMSLFLRLMVGAYNSGGLYCGGIVSKDKEDYNNDDEYDA